MLCLIDKDQAREQVSNQSGPAIPKIIEVFCPSLQACFDCSKTISNQKTYCNNNQKYNNHISPLSNALSHIDTALRQLCLNLEHLL